MLNTLQAGRGIAAIAVLLFHLNSGAIALTGIDIIPGAQFGDRGVDFFFVLSGFIIMLAHHKDIGQPARWSRFAYKRFARIFPIYWIYSLIVIVAMLIGLGNGDRLDQSAADWFSTFSLIRLTDVTTPIGPGWTLFHEVLFYAAFSVLIFNRKVGIALMAAWFGGCALLGTFPAGNVYSPYTTVISALNLDFLLGMGAFWASQRIRSSQLAAATTVAGLLFLIAGAALADSEVIQDAYLFGVGFALLMAGATNLERRRPISLPVMTLLGNASYSIYLVHETGLAASNFVLTKAGVTNPYVMVTLAGTAALLAGLAGYLFIEKPVMRWMRDRTPKAPTAPATTPETSEVSATASPRT